MVTSPQSYWNIIVYLANNLWLTFSGDQERSNDPGLRLCSMHYCSSPNSWKQLDAFTQALDFLGPPKNTGYEPKGALWPHGWTIFRLTQMTWKEDLFYWHHLKTYGVMEYEQHAPVADHTGFHGSLLFPFSYTLSRVSLLAHSRRYSPPVCITFRMLDAKIYYIIKWPRFLLYRLWSSDSSKCFL